MVQKRTALALLALVTLLSGILGGCGGAKPGSYNLSASWCQDVANNIKAIQPTEIPGSLAQDTGSKAGDEFDANGYFKVLTHLSIPSGYRLDYVYFLNESGGTPVLYTRQKDQEPFGSFQELAMAGANVTRPANDISIVWLVKEKNEEFKYGSQIKLDNSSESYYEYTVLQLLGGQFYLFYKANVYDVRIVSEATELDDVLADIDNSGLAPIDDAFKTTARSLDLQPVVKIGEKTVTVSLVAFTMWGGFSRVTFTLGREYPHSFTGYENQNLLKYDSGLKL